MIKKTLLFFKKLYCSHKRILHYFIITFIVIITYSGLTKTYFQQDEWYWFGQALYAQAQGLKYYFQALGHHFIPFGVFSFFFNI